jgi:hypothetical protein
MMVLAGRALKLSQSAISFLVGADGWLVNQSREQLTL